MRFGFPPLMLRPVFCSDDCRTPRTSDRRSTRAGGRPLARTTGPVQGGDAAMSVIERLRRLELASRRQRGGDDDRPQFWMLRGDGFARHGDQVLTQDEYAAQFGAQQIFTLL